MIKKSKIAKALTSFKVLPIVISRFSSLFHYFASLKTLRILNVLNRVIKTSLYIVVVFDTNTSTRLADTTQLSKVLNLSEKYCLNPRPVRFMSSSVTKITVKAEFICSNKACYSSSIGYLSNERMMVLVMMQQLIKKLNMLDF